jgi:hypothetical protein
MLEGHMGVESLILSPFGEVAGSCGRGAGRSCPESMQGPREVARLLFLVEVPGVPDEIRFRVLVDDVDDLARGDGRVV